MIHAVSEIVLQLLLNSFFRVFDNCKMRYGDGTGLDDLLAYLSVTPYVSSACSVGTGNVFRMKLTEFLDRLRKIIHSLICFRWKKFK